MMQQKFQLNIAICDDEALILQKLEFLCRNILENSYSLSFSLEQSPKALLHTEQVFHIALLDVVLLENSGIQLAREILQKNPGCRIIFVSGYMRVISDVYDVPHFCFILKDQLDSKLPKFLLRAAEICAQEAGMELSVKTREKIVSLPLKQIFLLERRGHWTYITMFDGTVIETREKLSELHCRMGSADFVRCHISYIVNLCYVRLLENRTLYLENNLQIPVSLPHEREVQEAFFRYMAK